MLVVIIIVLALTAAAIPVVMPALEGRRTREASRLLTSYMAGARDRALQAGRPMGVMLERFPGQPEMSITISEVEVPPPYAGDTVNSRIRIEMTTINGRPTPIVSDIGGGNGWLGTIRSGDALKLNYQGNIWLIDVTYLVFEQPNEKVSNAEGFLPDPTDTPWPLWSPTIHANTLATIAPLEVPFQIIRQPVKTARPPLELPTGIAIDLIHSGEADLDELFWPGFEGDMRPVVLLFGSTGSLIGLFHSEGPLYVQHPPDQPVLLLLGQREKIIPVAGNPAFAQPPVMGDPREAGNLLNVFDLTSRWISIQPSTGLISSSENAFVDPIAVPYPAVPFDIDEASFLNVLFDASRIAREGQSSGGD